MKPRDTKQLIDRPKKSLVASNQEAWQKGKEARIQWAKEGAEAVKLLRIEENYSEFPAAQFGYSHAERPASDILFGIIDPYAADDPESVKAFWEDITGNADQIETSLMKGFAVGAMEVWSTAKSEVLA